MRPITPSLIVLGGCLLAFGASFLNTGFLLTTGTSVSHLTGDIARIGSGLSTLAITEGPHIATVATATCGFIFGAIVSGFLLHHPTVEIRKPYGRILAALGLLLITAHLAYADSPTLSLALASAVCGAQNALASRYRGIVLRTTHLTGLFTDLGTHLGMKLRGHRIENWKLLVPVLITFSFLLGALASSAFIRHQRDDWILTAGLAYLLGGILWSIYKRVRNGHRPETRSTAEPDPR